MATQPRSTPVANPAGLPARHVYVMAGICFVLGLVAGYYFLSGTPRASIVRTQTAATAAAANGTPPQLTLEQMKQMADVQASTLLEKSKADPKNTALLVQIAGIY